MMEFISRLGNIRNLLGMFSGNSNRGSQQAPMPRGVLWARYGARLILLFLVLFIFIWWPADNYTPEGFDTWSKRMDALPDEVWYILLGVILSWGATEVMGARTRSAPYTPTIPITPPPSMEGGEDDPMMADEAALGRFANVDNDDPLLAGQNEPNETVEAWRAGATE